MTTIPNLILLTQGNRLAQATQIAAAAGVRIDSGLWLRYQQHMTDDECRMVGSEWDQLGVYRRAVWFACDTAEDIELAKKLITPERMRLLAGEMATTTNPG